MILRCPNCGARFRVPADALGPSGRRVRCSRCQHEWDATVNDLAPEPAPKKEKGRARKAAAGAAAKTKPVPPLRPAPSPPPPPVAAAPEPPPLPEPEPIAPPEPAPTTEAADDARLQAEAPAEPTTSPFEEMLAKAVTPPARKPPAKGPNLRRLLVAAGWVLLVVVVGGLAAAAYEHRAVMNAFPGTKPVYAFLGFEIPPPGEGLRLTNVNSSRVTTDGVPALVIEGKVTNTSDGPRSVPAMRGSLRDAKDDELQSWMFKADTATLKPGESTSFKTEVRQPSPRATGLSISFTAETK